MKYFALASCAALALAGCHGLRGPYAEKPVVVEAEGWVPADFEDLARSRQRALSEARRVAVEKANGAILTAATRVHKSVTVDQRIVSRVSGVVSRYKVLSQGVDGRFYRMTIRAWIRRAEPDDKEAEVYLPPPGDPSVSIRDDSQGTYARRSALGLRQGLSDRGVRLVEGVASDYVVTVESEVRPMYDSDLAGFSSYRARAVAKATETKSGRVLAQATEEASAMDIAAAGAAGKAAERAGMLAGQSLARNLGESLQVR